MRRENGESGPVSRSAVFGAAALFLLPSIAQTAPPVPEAAIAPANDLKQILKTARQLELKGDYRAACRTYLSALPDHAADLRIQTGLKRAAGALARDMDAQRQKATDRYVRDAQMSADRSYAYQKSQRDRVVKAKRLISKGQYLAASDALNTILEESPGMDEARDQLDRATRLMAGRLKRGKFPTVQHQAVWEGLVFYNRADFESAARSLRLALSAGSIPTDLADARVENYAVLAEKKQALALWRQERQILLLKAENAKKDGDLAAAKASYERILNKDPGDADARAGLENLGSVVKAVEKAVVKEVRRKEVPDLLAKGTIDMVHERYTDALESFHAVLQLEPDNAEAKEQINEVQRLMKGRKLYVPPVNVKSAADDKYREGLKLYGNEQYSEAQAAFEEALQIDPKHDDARQALKRLKDQAKQP